MDLTSPGAPANPQTNSPQSARSGLPPISIEPRQPSTMNMSNPFPVDDDLPMAEPVGVAQRPGVALVRSAAPTFGTYLSIVRERKWGCHKESYY